MHKPITRNIIFRTIFPIIFGIFAYLVVLMIFDNVQLIFENFFSKEVAFFIVLSFTIFELLLFIFRFIDSKQLLENKENIKLGVFTILSVTISILTVSVFTYLYFSLVENTSVFKTELIVFNFIMAFASLLYLTIFYSISLIAKQAEKAISIEIIEKENINKRLKLLQTKVRPEILYESLEILINLIHKDEKAAEEFITQLSTFYRNIIEERHTETVSLKQEIEAAESLILLLDNKYKGQISLKKPKGNVADYQTIPGIIQQLVFNAVQKNIVTEYLPLLINLDIANGYLSLSYNCHMRLIKKNELTETLADIVNKYKIYSDRKIDEEQTENYYKIRVPLLTMETV